MASYNTIENGQYQNNNEKISDHNGVAGVQDADSKLVDEVNEVLLNEQQPDIQGGSSSSDSVQYELNHDLRVFKTMALYTCFCALGLATSLIGSTLVHMEILFGTNTKTMSFTFTGHSIGYTIGALMCGFAYDRANKEFCFSVAIMVQAYALISATFIYDMYGYMGAMATVGLAQGFIDAASQSYCVGLWYNHRLKEPLLQAAHAFWSLGAAIGPLIIQQFLVELNHPSSPTSEYLTSTMPINITSLIPNVSTTLDEHDLQNSDLIRFENNENSTMNTVTQHVTTSGYDLNAIESARYAYLTIGCLMLASALPYLILYFYKCDPICARTSRNSATSSSVNPNISTSVPHHRVFYLLLLLLLFTFYYLYLYIENIPSGFFVNFVIRGLSWSVKEATTLVMVFFIFHCAGRFLAIPLSAVLRPRTMVGVNITTVAVAYILLLFVHYEGKIMWLSASMAGIGMASTFAAMILWTSESVEISGKVASVMLVGSSLGGATGPAALVGYLIDTFDLMWVPYVLVISGGMHIIIYIVFIFFFRWRQNIVRDHSE